MGKHERLDDALESKPVPACAPSLKNDPRFLASSPILETAAYQRATKGFFEPVRGSFLPRESSFTRRRFTIPADAALESVADLIARRLSGPPLGQAVAAGAKDGTRNNTMMIKRRCVGSMRPGPRTYKPSGVTWLVTTSAALQRRPSLCGRAICSDGPQADSCIAANIIGEGACMAPSIPGGPFAIQMETPTTSPTFTAHWLPGSRALRGHCRGRRRARPNSGRPFGTCRGLRDPRSRIRGALARSRRDRND